MKTAPEGGIRGRRSAKEEQPFHPLVSICQFEKLGPKFVRMQAKMVTFENRSGAYFGVPASGLPLKGGAESM